MPTFSDESHQDRYLREALFWERILRDWELNFVEYYYGA